MQARDEGRALDLVDAEVEFEGDGGEAGIECLAGW